MISDSENYNTKWIKFLLRPNLGNFVVPVNINMDCKIKPLFLFLQQLLKTLVSSITVLQGTCFLTFRDKREIMLIC